MTTRIDSIPKSIPALPRSTALAVASSYGFGYLRGGGEPVGGRWFGRHTRHADGEGPALYVGLSRNGRRWVLRIGE